jgi:hypothetical protein
MVREAIHTNTDVGRILGKKLRDDKLEITKTSSGEYDVRLFVGKIVINPKNKMTVEW